MTKISAYPEIAVPTIDDLLIGTDVETQNQTKNFSIQSVIDLVTLQQVVDSGNTIVVPTTVSEGIDITLSNSSTVHQNGISVTIPTQTGEYPTYQPAPDAFVANINGQTPGSLAGSVVGFLSSATGDDNVAFFADLTATSGTSRGYDVNSFDAHTGDYFTARKYILGADSVVFKVANNGDTTAKSFIKTGGTSDQFLKADGSTSTTPTLQQVVDAGNVVLDNTISIYGEGQTAISAFSTGLETVTIVNDSSGVGLRVDSQEGEAIIATSNESTAIAGNSTDGAGIVGSSENGFGVQGQSNEGYGGRFSSSESYGINVSSQNSVAGYFNSPSDTAVQGQSSDGWGGYFTSNGGYGVHGSASDGYGGYFTSAADYALVANGTAAKPGGGSWSVFSDSRIKENITPYTKGLADILLINTVTYEYNGLAGTTKGAKYTGVIAQEMKEIFPETVSTYKAKLNEEDEEKTELYDFNSSDLTFALINAVKELKAEIEILKAK